mmetsp:Transcript_22089/g.56418  ORF Transcript_22089/g.56418 Transcript_22089/m.56418 type:complete len:281 (-) Transcript_22089:168-1010(-)
MDSGKPVHPVRRHADKDSQGHLSGGWQTFYKTNQDVDNGKPQLRTYTGRQAEKFYETSAQALGPARPGKGAVPPAKESLTWGIGGTLAAGRLHCKPFPAADFKYSSKKYIPGERSEEMSFHDATGAKKHVYDAHGNDRQNFRSAGYLLEDTIGKKKLVPEEVRCDKRTIHRMAPPGLKGYMGSEYSNEFFLKGTYRTNDFMLRPYYQKDCDINGDEPTAIERPPRKSFKQKRIEEDFGLQVDLVSNGLGSIPLASGDGEVIDSEDECEQEEGEMEKVAAD